MSITLRIGTKVGAWKLTGLSLSSSIASVQSEIEAKHEIPVALQVLTLAGRRGGAEGGALAPSATLASLGLEHGSKLFCDWDGDKCIAARKSTRKTIDAQGNIVDVDYEAVAADKGFRPGMLALRSMKMQWTLAEFQSLDSKFVYDFKDIKQGKGFNAATAVCPGVSLDRSCLESFQRFVAQFQYKRARCGFLYGRRAEDGSITVEAIYEPPQTFTLPTRLRALADHEPRSRDEIRLVAGQVYFGDELDRASGVWFGRELVGVVEGSFPAAKVEEIPSEPCDGELDIDEDDKAALVTHLYERCLGLERVGWIVSHPPRKESLSGHTEYVSQFTASEIVEGASLQLEASMARLARAESERAAADSFGSGVVSMEEEGGGGAEDEEPDAKLVGGSFVSIKLTANADGNAEFDAFQISKRCMRMYREGVFCEGPTPFEIGIGETFTAMVKGKPAEAVECDYFIQTVPIKNHDGMFDRAARAAASGPLPFFPRANRFTWNGEIPTNVALREHLAARVAAPLFEHRIADPHVLLYLCELGLADEIEAVCAAVMDDAVTLEEGYKLMIDAMSR